MNFYGDCCNSRLSALKQVEGAFANPLLAALAVPEVHCIPVPFSRKGKDSNGYEHYGLELNASPAASRAGHEHKCAWILIVVRLLFDRRMIAAFDSW